MPSPATNRAQRAYGAASHRRQQAVVADTDRIELAIVHEQDAYFGLIMADYRAGSLSDATLRRRLDEFSAAVERLLGDGLTLGGVEWWGTAVDLWAVAVAVDPALMGAIAFSAPVPLVEDNDQARARAALVEILPAPSAKEVRSIVNAPINGTTWRERLRQMTNVRVSQASMSKAIADAYAAGGNIKDVEQAIRPLVQVSTSAARTIARTESMRVANAMHERSMEQAGDALIGYTRRATMDSVTRPEHARANGRVYKKDEPRPSMPLAVNCRCWYDPILSSDVTVFGRPGSLPPEARHVEAFARWFDDETPARKVAAAGHDAFEAAATMFGTTSPTWEQIASASPTIETERIRGTLDQKAAAAKELRRRVA